jgi:integrase
MADALLASTPRLEPAELRPPTPQQVAALLESVRSSAPDLYMYLRLAVCTGARRSQLLALRWGDVDADRSVVSFTRALVEGPDGPQLRGRKSRRAYRVALDPVTLRVLMDHRRTLPAAVSADWFVLRRVSGPGSM